MASQPSVAVCLHLALIALLAASPSSAQSPPDPAAAAGNVSSVGQRGGVTAGVVNELNVYSGRDSPVEMQLSSALASYGQWTGEQAKSALNSPGYMWLMHENDGDLGSREGLSKFYWLVFEEAYRGPSCGTETRLRVEGALAVIEVRGDAMLVRMSMVQDLADPIVAQICSALAQPQPSGQTRFDQLSLGQGAVVISLIPFDKTAAFEEFGRYFWSGAFVSRYVGDPMSSLPPEVMSDFVRTGEAEFVTDLSFGQPFGATYPAAAREEFGEVLEEFDRAWLEELGKSAVTLRGRKFFLGSEEARREVLRTYQADEISSEDFWRSASDIKYALLQMSCIGSRFLVSRGIAEQGDLPAYGACSVAQITGAHQ